MPNKSRRRRSSSSSCLAFCLNQSLASPSDDDDDTCPHNQVSLTGGGGGGGGGEALFATRNTRIDGSFSFAAWHRSGGKAPLPPPFSTQIGLVEADEAGL
jgi:hypothetical protein